MIVIAANAGGAWSPLGDVTTTMLWIGGQITAVSIIKQLILPSLAVCLVPALLICRYIPTKARRKIEHYSPVPRFRDNPPPNCFINLSRSLWGLSRPFKPYPIAS